METALRAAGICGTFRATSSAGDRTAEAGGVNGGPIDQNQFLCNRRAGFRAFVADVLLLLLRLPVQHLWTGLLTHRVGTNQPASRTVRRPRSGHRRVDPFGGESAVRIRDDLAQSCTPPGKP